MTFVRRLAYLAYYLRRLDWSMLGKFMDYLQNETGWSRTRQWVYIVRDSLKFNISILEYYQFRFFELSPAEKGDWAGTGTMYEFQRRANPAWAREVLHDKREFYKTYRKFFKHEVYGLEDLLAEPEIVDRLLEENDRLVFKDATGNCGSGVSIRSVSDLSPAQLIDLMKRERFDMLETFAEQHPALNELSPSAVNTVRIFTQISKSRGYEILGCRLRISVDSPVDNLAAGNIAAPVDAQTGVINGPGVFSDITREPAVFHPVTDVPIVGFPIPYWDETLKMVEAASLLHQDNRSVGWDVVITEDGPGLIEGNHDWCKLVWQLPVRRGLKPLLDLG